MSLMVSGRIGKTHNHEYSGRREIIGTVYEDGVPGKYECVLSTKRERQIIQRTVSSADGSYSFQCIKAEDAAYRIGYYVTFFDHGSDPARPWVADNLVLTDMAVEF